VTHAAKTLADGDNLSHAGRFLLATFLLARGHPISDIVPYFEKAPDYKKSVTLYQLEHLAGKSGKSTAYRCQSCQKLKTLGLCHETPECAGIVNPLQFGVER
jgi:DNA primase large subunit